jgi:hypothetical protein
VSEGLAARLAGWASLRPGAALAVGRKPGPMKFRLHFVCAPASPAPFLSQMNVVSGLSFWSHAARNPLAAAFAMSLGFHLFCYGGYKLVPASFFARQGALARLLAKLTFSERNEQKRLERIKQLANEKLFADTLRELQNQNQQEIPLTFVEVDPALASEPPKNPQYYASHDTTAANPDSDKDLVLPKIDGKETRVPRLYNNPRPQPEPLQPISLPKPPEPSSAHPGKPSELRPDSKPDSKSEPLRPLDRVADTTHDRAWEKPDLRPLGGEKPGDLVMGTPKPSESANRLSGSGSPVRANPLITEPGPTTGERPRTLAQVAQRNPALAGRLMQQDGGARKRGRLAVDARGSLFGAYDTAFIAAVQERWYQLLESNPYMAARQGKVVLDFRLRADGHIADLTVGDNTVGEVLGLLCRRAVEDPAPYARWPAEMRRTVGTDFREVRFTFYYD